MNVLGIDIGGSGIKGAPVDTKTGELVGARHRIPTPQPATPKAVAEVVAKLVDHFQWTGPVGITFPGVVVDGVIRTAANVDKSWIGVNANKLFGKKLDSVMVLNDADAAGMAEMAFGAGKNNQGVVLVMTIGTGIGSALFMGGKLVPNTEFGHLELKGKEAESRASDAARDKRNMSWGKYAKRIGQYLRHMEMLFSPAMMILGGGISKKSDKYLPMVDLRTPVVPAKLLNEAGIIGAALAAEETMALKPSRPATSRRTTARRTTSTTSRPRGARATTGATRSAARRSAATTPNRGTSSRSGTRSGTTTARRAASGTSRSTTGRSATGRSTTRSTPARKTGTTSRSTTSRSTTSRATPSRSTTGRSTTSRSTTARKTGTTSRATPSRSTTGRSTTGRSTTGRSTTAQKTGTTSRSTPSRSTSGRFTAKSGSNGTPKSGRSTTSRSTRTSPARSTSRSNGTPSATARRTTRSAGGTTRRSATPKRSNGSRRMRG
uniref:polyphosphate--glucose phosphotransferase n=1 Tax=Herbidospora sakaeratensis TaxID=564415 RepID=UPI0007C63EC1